MVLIGFVAHASTGLLSSALLALGDVGPVVAYKAGQLIGAAVLLVPAALIGPRTLAGALTLALVLPALVFNRHATRRLGVGLPGRGAAVWRRLAAGAAATAGAALVITLLSRDELSPAVTLALALAPAAACALLTWRWSSRTISTA